MMLKLGAPRSWYWTHMASPLVVGVLGKLLTASISRARSGESKAGGGGGRRASAEGTMSGFQKRSAAPTGLVPFHSPGPSGIWPSQVAVSKWSDWAAAMASPATAWPMSSPAVVSLGYWTPAHSRELA